MLQTFALTRRLRLSNRCLRRVTLSKSVARTNFGTGQARIISSSQKRSLELNALALTGEELNPVFHIPHRATLKANGHLQVQVLLKTGAAKQLDVVARTICQRLEAEIDLVSKSSVQFIRQQGTRHEKDLEGIPDALRNVRHVIGVGSCKGGVGKSTVTVNLAFALADQGAKVGILDSDIYGSSLGHLLHEKIPGRDLHTNAMPLLKKDPDTNLIKPLALGRVTALMSYGFIAPGVSTGEDKPITVRGPVASQIINQIICGTDWGDLDYLLVDVPPGTGDIQLTMYQQMPFDGHILVTTPHAASIADVEKTVKFLHETHVPIIGVVENMSYYFADGKKHHIFGRPEAGLQAIKTMCAANNSSRISSLPETDVHFTLPIDADLSDCSKCPIIDHTPESESSCVFKSLASSLVEKIAENAFEEKDTATLIFDENSNRLVLSTKTDIIIDVLTLRKLSRDATSTSRTKSRQKLDDSIIPTKINRKGNYGFEIQWSDGLTGSIYTFSQLLSAAVEDDN